VSLRLPAVAGVGPGALGGLTSLRHLRLHSLAKFDKTALDGTRIDEIELNEVEDVDAEFLARLAPTRLICGRRTIEVEEEHPNLRRFTFDGVADIPTAGALELTVVDKMLESFPECVRVLDLLRADVAKLESVNGLPFLRRLIVPAKLERVCREGVARCSRLEEVNIGCAPLRKLEPWAFFFDVALEHFAMPATLESIGPGAFEGTSISRFDASECVSLVSFETSSLPHLFDVILPIAFSGALTFWLVMSVERATFGSVELFGHPVLVFDEVRFVAFGPPRGKVAPKMFAKASIFGEASQLLGREMAPARPA
jgi:hypothetical protein